MSSRPVATSPVDGLDDRAASEPVSLAIVNDYRVVIAGLEALLSDHGHRVSIIELVANMPVDEPVDVVLYDTFARPEPGLAELRTLVANPNVGHVVVFSWSFDDDLIRLSLSLGASGYISKTSSAESIVDAIERVARGEQVVSSRTGRALHNDDLDWPGKQHDLAPREAEVLALITQGKSNKEIATLLHLSVNTIKTVIRGAYRKIGARNRVDAVIWGTSHGMTPDRERVRNQ